MKFIDLFCGIGGFHYAMKQCDPEATLIMASEIDKHAKEAYSLNHKIPVESMMNIRDYTGKDAESIKKMEDLDHPDIILGGFPCQTFSNAGKKLGFIDETKGTLFFDVAKMIEKKKPKYVLLENVKHLVNHDDGNT